MAFAPVFLANLVFTYSFRDTRTADMAFASNLLGAMVGGALEYLALLTGYRVLLILVAALYALAWLFATRWRRLADVDLATGAEGGAARADLAGEETAAASSARSPRQAPLGHKAPLDASPRHRSDAPFLALSQQVTTRHAGAANQSPHD